MRIKMDKRQEKLLDLQKYTEKVDKEITMMLQSLQWDRKHLLEGSTLVSCKYDANHRVPPERKRAHEEQCALNSQGYAADDILLPDPPDDTAPTLVKFSLDDITQIICKAAQNDPSFKRGPGCGEQMPATAERLQASFTADERRAIHDAAVSAAPDLWLEEHLAVPGGAGEEVKKRPKSKLEVLAELRDMRRRRAKYRGACAASSNYSNVLRDVIKTQMELFTGIKEELEVSISNPVNNKSEQLNYKHNYDSKVNGRDDSHGKHKDEYKTNRYEESSRSRDKRNYDNYKEKQRNKEDKERYRQREKYGDFGSKNDRVQKYFKKERESATKDYYELRNEHSDSRYKDKRKRDDDRKFSDKYISKSESHRGSSESRSERSYKSEKHGDSSSRSTKRQNEAYDERSDDTRNSRRHREHHDDSRRRRRDEIKREDEYAIEKKHKRYS